MMASDYQIIIIGAGVVGLAVARTLAEKGKQSVLIIDRETGFGRGISGRNSEVIHSGIYYPQNTLKSKYCIKGRDLLYQYCASNNVFHQKCGKIIKNGWCQILGSDSHDNKRRNFCLMETVELIRSWGENRVDAMVRENPKAVIDGTPISVDFDYVQEDAPNFLTRIKDRIGLT